MKTKGGAGSLLFEVCNDGLMILLGAVTLFPFLHIVSKSISGIGVVNAGLITIFPKDLQFEAVRYVLGENQFRNSLGVSVFVTLMGTLLAMILTIITAYPLSKPGLRGRKYFLYVFIFIMLFHGGMIPNYLLYSTLGLINNIWALVLSGMFSVFNMLIVKNYFEGLPESIEEAASIDGASGMRILFTVVLPMSSAVIATISLFYAVGYWNNYFSAVLYITDQKLKPLQQYLYDLVRSSMELTDSMGTVKNIDEAINISPETIRAATIVVSTLPILVVYPFLQKHFIKGITIGSVKG